MTSLFLSLLLTAASVDLPHSELVSDEHDHQWSVIERENEEVVMLDRAETADYSDDNGAYGTALVRGIEPNRDGSTYFVDFLIAIDCERSMLAPIGSWEPKLQNETPKLRPDEIGKFVLANDRNDERTLTAVFQHVCGPEWKFEAR